MSATVKSSARSSPSSTHPSLEPPRFHVQGRRGLRRAIMRARMTPSAPLSTASTPLIAMPSRKRAAAAALHIPSPTLCALTAVFWLFVTLTNVFYGYNMQLSADQIVPNSGLFAEWDVRILQHALLFPFLLGAFAL